MAMITIFCVFVDICVLRLVVLLDWYIFVFGGASLVYNCGLAVDLVRLYFWESMLACVHICVSV